MIEEIFFLVAWEKLIKPFLFYTGIAYRLLLNSLFNFKSDPYNRSHNATIGFFVWGFVLLIYVLVSRISYH